MLAGNGIEQIAVIGVASEVRARRKHHTFAAINQRDIPLVQAGVILLAGIFILLNLLVDLVYVRLDPRVKLAGGRG